MELGFEESKEEVRNNNIFMSIIMAVIAIIYTAVILVYC